MNTRTLYRFLQAINISQRFFIQDFSLPEEKAVGFLNYSDEKTKIYPIWLCPLKTTEGEKLSPTYLKTDLCIDIGIWGKLKTNYISFVNLNKDFEGELSLLGGRKWLYAHSYYSEEEFWKVYDKPSYEALRNKFNAQKVFIDIYTKTKVNEKYETKPLRGLWNVIKSPKRLPISGN